MPVVLTSVAGSKLNYHGATEEEGIAFTYTLDVHWGETVDLEQEQVCEIVWLVQSLVVFLLTSLCESLTRC